VQQFDAELSLNPNDTCLPLMYRNNDGEPILTMLNIRMWLSGQKRMGVATLTRPDA